MTNVLKHRDRVLLRFEWGEGDRVRLCAVEDANRRFLPIEFGAAAEKGNERELESALSRWLTRRTAPMGRHFMRDLMFSLGLNMRDPEFHRKALAFSKGLSLTDVHWVVPEGFRGTWDACNLYANDFSKSMAEIAFSGRGMLNPQEATTSPEMTTNGMLPKCWRRVKGNVLLFKGGTGGSSGASTFGLEPYSEFYAAQVAEALGFAHVDYGLSMYKRCLCSTCLLFTSEKVGYLPAAGVPDRRAVLSDPRFAETFLFDALVFNTDRHLGNFGYLVDNDTNEIIGAAPIFDNGYGLFSLADIQFNDGLNGVESIRASLHGRHPALFDHWLGFPGATAGRLKSAAERLRGFRFKRHQHYNLPTDRLEAIQRFLQIRVSDILQYGEKADEYIEVAKWGVGVNSKAERASVGVRQETLDPLALQILWNMRANALVTGRELAVILGVEQRTVERRIRALREKSLVRHVGEDKSGHWEVLV